MVRGWHYTKLSQTVVSSPLLLFIFLVGALCYCSFFLSCFCFVLFSFCRCSNKLCRCSSDLFPVQQTTYSTGLATTYIIDCEDS